MVEKVEVGDTTSSRKEGRRAEAAGRAPALAGRHRTAVSVDVDAERCSPRYHETSLALESLEIGAAVGEPCSGSLCSLIQDLEVACRLEKRMQKQQPQELAMDAARCAERPMIPCTRFLK